MYFNPPVLSCYVSVSYIWNETLLYFSNKLLWYTWIKVQTVTFQVLMCAFYSNQIRPYAVDLLVYVLGFNNNNCSPFGYTFTDIPFLNSTYLFNLKTFIQNCLHFFFFFLIYIFPSRIYRTPTQPHCGLQKKKRHQYKRKRKWEGRWCKT